MPPDLAAAVPIVVEDYHRFLRSSGGGVEEPKEFGARHAAARAALAHIEQLAKLIGEAAGEPAAEAAGALLAEARGDIPAPTEAERKEAEDGDGGAA